MNNWSYLAESIAWAACGFLGGYLVGRTSRDLHHVARATAPASRRAWPVGQVALGVVIALLGVLTVVQGMIATRATERITACQAEYSNRMADALEARTTASTEAQHALDELIRTLVSDTSTQDSRRAAVRTYLQQREQVEQQRRNNPYPPPPREFCPEER